MELLELLESMVEQKAPDLILKVGARPTVRVRGGLLQLAEEELTRDFLLRVVASLLDDRRMEAFVRGSEVDLAYEVAGLARFRVNVFHQMGMPAVVFRHINAEVPTFAELNLPAEQLIKLASLRRGLVPERHVIDQRREGHTLAVIRGVADLAHGYGAAHEAIAERDHTRRRRVLLIAHLDRVLVGHRARRADKAVLQA